MQDFSSSSDMFTNKFEIIQRKMYTKERFENRLLSQVISIIVINYSRIVSRILKTAVTCVEKLVCFIE